MICPKCEHETSKETCPSCGVIFTKIHNPKDRPALPIRSPRRKSFAWDVLTIKILWIGNLVYFNAHSIGVSGEGNLFYAIFDIAMAFPSSLVLIPLGILYEGTISPRGYVEHSSGNDVATTMTLCMVVLMLGYVQWFIMVPRLARAGWRLVDKVAERSPNVGKWLVKGVSLARVLLRWGGAGYFLVLALYYIEGVPLAVLFFSGAIAVFLAFSPRERAPQVVID